MRVVVPASASAFAAPPSANTFTLSQHDLPRQGSPTGKSFVPQSVLFRKPQPAVSRPRTTAHVAGVEVSEGRASREEDTTQCYTSADRASLVSRGIATRYAGVVGGHAVAARRARSRVPQTIVELVGASVQARALRASHDAREKNDTRRHESSHAGVKSTGRARAAPAESCARPAML